MEVFLVDDYDIFRRQLKEMPFWKSHAEVEICGEASDGAAALTELRKKPVDILITDIKMPKLNGIELLSYVKKENLSKCVILFSEYADFEYARKGLVLGAFDYIVKPVVNRALTDVMFRAMEYVSSVGDTSEKKMDDENIIVGTIIASTNHLNDFLCQFEEKCYDNGNVIKGNARLMDAVTYIGEEVCKTYQWISMVTVDPQEVSTRILQSEDRVMGATYFENYVNELYTAVKKWHPEGINDLTQKVVDYVLAHPYDKLTLTETATICYVSNAYLSHTFKQQMGCSYVDYVTALKMRIVKKFVEETNMGTPEIAEKVGYEDAKYMGRLFKKTYGFTLGDCKRMKE